MRTLYESLGLRSLSRRSAREPNDNSPTSFERHLHDLELGTAALNLIESSVHLAAEIAAFEDELDDQQRIGLILLVLVSLAALEEGSTRFPVCGALSIAPMRRLLSPLCGESFGIDGVERMRIAIERMVVSDSASGVIGSNSSDYKPLIFQTPFIYQQRILSNEMTLGMRLASLIGRRAKADLGTLDRMTTLSATFGGTPIDLSDEQRAAIECATTAPLTIITGGPGTGKTSIMRAIVKVMLAAGLDREDIALAAPTGKAAFRIGEALRDPLVDPADTATSPYPQPTTIHRLLGYSPTRRRFRYYRHNPLRAQVVVVDEGSMLDLELMSRLVDALRPDAKLVVLGDADQLPSVAAGSVFRDLLLTVDESSPLLSRNCVRLTRSYRTDRGEESGKAIFRLASAINAGERNLFVPETASPQVVTRRESAEQVEFAGSEWLDAEAVSGEFLEHWYAKRIRGDGGIDNLRGHIFTAGEEGFPSAECESLRSVFENVARSRVLCFTRVLDSGSERINSLLHRRVAHDLGASFDREPFLAGEPVMVLRNDYQRMLFNGDQGVVLRVRRPDSEVMRMAVFSRGENFVAFPMDALKDHLELCYAMTVHKAQGSEFDSVAVIMPSQDIPILSREILYTAVSRARRSVTIIGSTDVMQAGLSRRIERYSGLREHLEKFLSESPRV